MAFKLKVLAPNGRPANKGIAVYVFFDRGTHTNGYTNEDGEVEFSNDNGQGQVEIGKFGYKGQHNLKGEVTVYC